MKTVEFLSVLQNNTNKELLFEYAPDKLVGANYHITEVKNVAIQSVDCGGKPNNWNETVVQLWESAAEKDKSNYLKTEKALSIFKTVDSINPLWGATEIKFEYGNETFHTAQLKASDVSIFEDKIIVKLHTEKTQCKALDACGIPETITQESSCCSPTASSQCC